MTELAPQVGRPATLIDAIAAAARDEKMDVAKFQALVAMHLQLADRDARVQYLTDLAEMQPQLPDVTERGGITNNSGQVQSTYALWEDINQAIKPILAAHGFNLSFRTGRADGAITVTGVLGHRGGHQEETTIVLPLDTTGNKNAVQAVASSVSYGKRYTAGALLNLTSRGEDDDGQAAGGDAARALEERFMAELNMFDTTAELQTWRAKNADTVKTDLPAATSARVIEHFRRRLRITAAKEEERAAEVATSVEAIQGLPS